MKKLLYANQSMGMGGAEVFLADLLWELQQLNWQITVATTSQPFKKLLQEKSLEANKIHHLTIIIDLIGNWKGLLKAVFLWPFAVKQWRKILLQADPSSLILLSGFSEKLLVTPLAKKMGFKVIWIEFSSLRPVFAMWGGIIGKWYAQVVASVDGILTSSLHSQQALHKELTELGLTTTEQPAITVIACGSRAQVIKKPQQKTENIVCISRLQQGKGQDLLLQAMPDVLIKHPQARLYMLGEGDYLPMLQRLAKQLQIEQQVTFTGRVKTTQEWLAKAAVSVFPSMWELEGFGLVIIESMAAGVPVVAFDRGPSQEIIQHDKTGLLVKPGSSSALAKAISRLLEDRKLAAQLAQAAQRTYQQRYTIEQVATTYDSYLTHHHHQK